MPRQRLTGNFGQKKFNVKNSFPNYTSSGMSTRGENDGGTKPGRGNRGVSGITASKRKPKYTTASGVTAAANLRRSGKKFKKELRSAAGAVIKSKAKSKSISSRATARDSIIPYLSPKGKSRTKSTSSRAVVKPKAMSYKSKPMKSKMKKTKRPPKMSLPLRGYMPRFG